MPKLSPKRQITLTIDQCRDADIKPGDEYSSYVDGDGRITIIKKVDGAARGLLSNAKVSRKYEDDESLQSRLRP